MAENLKVLVWGHVEDGPCAYFRGHQFSDELLKLGVEYKGISRVDFDVAESGRGMLLPEAFSKGLVRVDSKDINSHYEIDFCVSSDFGTGNTKKRFL